MLARHLAVIGAATIHPAKIVPLEYPADQIESLMSVVRRDEWPTPHDAEAARTHPLYCNRGRRSLARGVSDARLHLAGLDDRQLLAELRDAIGARDGMPIMISRPKNSGMRVQGGWWNLGTLRPSTISTDLNGYQPVSAWLAALAWEAQTVLPEVAVRGILRRKRDDADPTRVNRLRLPFWGYPLDVAEVARLYHDLTLWPDLVTSRPEWSLSNRLSKIAAEYYPCGFRRRKEAR